MNSSPAISARQYPVNIRAFGVVAACCGLGYLLAIAWLVWHEKKIPVLLMTAGPALLLLIALPRAMLYLFTFLLFAPWLVLESPFVSVIDAAAGVLILTALLDVLLRADQAPTLPPLRFNYLFVLLALFVTGLFGANFAVSVFPLARVTLLFLTFLAIYRLAGYVRVIDVIRVFFWTAVLHACFAVVPFLASGGQLRSFGLLRATLDDLMMLALPIGLCLFLWSKRREATLSLVGSAIVFGALVATQSRASILFGLATAGLVMLLSKRWASKMSHTAASESTEIATVDSRIVSRRLRTLVVLGLLATVAAVLLRPGAIGGVLGRFERLASARPADTVRLRLILWREAFNAFLDHPLLGIGPGNFRRLADLYPTLHLSPLFIYTRGLSAHNLLLHYLAESGLVGGVALVALFGNHARIAWQSWRQIAMRIDFRPQFILYILALLFFVTMLLEAGWMWGQTGFVAAFFFALTARVASSAFTPE